MQLSLTHPRPVRTADRLTCTRCARTTRVNAARPGNASNVSTFWRSRCFDNRGQASLRGLGRAAAVWAREKPKHQALVHRIGEEHGGEVIWSGEKYGPVRCRNCEWRQPLFMILRQNRNALKSASSLGLPLCPGTTRASDADFDGLTRWLAAYKGRRRAHAQRQKMHEWQSHTYTIFCVQCNLYLHRAPYQNSAADRDNCLDFPDLWSRVMKAEVAANRTWQQRLAIYDGLPPERDAL